MIPESFSKKWKRTKVKEIKCLLLQCCGRPIAPITFEQYVMWTGYRRIMVFRNVTYLYSLIIHWNEIIILSNRRVYKTLYTFILKYISQGCQPSLAIQKQPYKSLLRKRCSENMQQIYRRTPMPRYNFNKIALQLYWNRTSAGGSLVNFLNIFRTTFPKNTSEQLLLVII